MNMLIVNPNPVFDRTINVVELIPGAVIRTLAVEPTARGKGITVARVLRAHVRATRMLLPIGAKAERIPAILAHLEGPHPIRIAVGSASA